MPTLQIVQCAGICKLRQSSIVKLLCRAGWFDLYQIEKLAQGVVDHDGIRASAEYLGGLVAQEIEKGLRSERIVVGGFSQACSILPVSHKKVHTTKAYLHQ